MSIIYIIAYKQAHIQLLDDDTGIFMVVNLPNETAAVLLSDIDNISSWADKLLVFFRPFKSESILISCKINKPSHT